MENNFTPIQTDLQITTSSGYLIKLKRKKLLWGEKKQLKNKMRQMFKVDPIALKELENDDNALKDVKVSLQFPNEDEISEQVMNMLIESITTPTGQVITSNFVEWLDSQEEDVGQEVVSAFNTITKEVTTEETREKKG